MSRPQQIVLAGALGVFTIAICGWNYPQSKQGGRGGTLTSSRTDYSRVDSPNGHIDWGPIERRQSANYQSEGCDPFSYKCPDRRPPVARPTHPLPRGNSPQTPSAPDLPMKFFGYGSIPTGSLRRAFLEDGADVYVVHEGDTLLGHYRILKINNSNLEFEEVDSGRRGQKMLEDQGPAA